MAVRVDSHQHFWQYTPAEYPWISEGMPELRRDRLPADLEPHLAAARMDMCIAVQARPSLAETHWLLELSRKHSFIGGVIGWFDLCSPGLEADLDALPWPNRLVGVRAMLQDEHDDDHMLREEFRRGLKAIGESGFTYDLLVFPRHLPYALRLVRQFPSVRFVIDHLAKPPIASGELEPWARLMRELGHEPNVACKLSGIVTEAAPDWKQADLTPYQHIPSKIPFDEMNPPARALQGRQRWAAEQSAAMNWHDVDDIPADTLNRILWGDAKGWDHPYPQLQAGLKPKR